MKRNAPAAERNRQPILDALRPHLPPKGLVLEIASGTGQHTAFFAQALPALTFQPSDPNPAARSSIDAWCEGMPNVCPALALDAASASWPIDAADAVLCINMIHISPWEATEGLMRGAGRLGGRLFLYGPYKRFGAHTAPSNEAFDADLRAQDPAWGVRDMEAVVALAEAQGFAAPVVVPMPANNFSLIFSPRSPGRPR